MSTQNTSVTANTELFKEDGSINNTYANPNDSSQFATSPNTTTEASKSNTGSGLQAPEVNKYDSAGNLVLNDAGKPVTEKLQYSWESKADERANLDYQSNILETKANMLENRQQLESQGQQLQDQAAMEQYNRNQSAEKVGWTGGYILDSERQMNYLKQSIQSQMYGQMELQKYGYDTSLAAARLAYDTNRYDLALEYYNTALSRAVTEAEITGYYVSPEASEMLDQYHIASKALNENPEDAQAQSVLKGIYDWFEGHGISKNGVETYSHLVEERTHKMSLDQLYEYQNAAQNQISTDTFVKLDENGNKIYGETGMETINFSKMDGTALKEYITNPDGTINEQKRDQYYSRLDSLSYEMENNFATWCKNQGYTDAEGNTNTDDFKEAFAEYLETTDLADKLAKELNRLGSDDAEFVTQLVDNWDCDLKLPDGSEFTIKMVRSGTGMSGSKTTDENGITTGTTNTTNSNITTIKLPDGTSIEAAYMKPQKTADAVIKLLNTNNYSNVYNTIANLEIEDYKDIDNLIGQILGVGAVAGGTIGGIASIAVTQAAMSGSLSAQLAGISAASFGGVGAALGSATGVGAAIAIGLDTTITWVKDMFTSDDWAKKKEGLELVKNGLLNSIGESNINLLKSAYEEYNDMDDYTKNGLSSTKKQMYEDASKFYKNYSAIIQAIDYCSHYDSNIFDSDLFEYTGDIFSRIGDRWDDGYQFGDVMGTVVDGAKGVLTGIGEVGLALIGKGWLW